MYIYILTWSLVYMNTAEILHKLTEESCSTFIINMTPNVCQRNEITIIDKYLVPKFFGFFFVENILISCIYVYKKGKKLSINRNTNVQFWSIAFLCFLLVLKVMC